jgi:hypothetical protein
MTQRIAWILGGALIVSAATQVFAGEVQIARVNGRLGQPVSVPVTYRAGSGPATTALSTDIHFDKELTNPRCAPGAVLASGAADKQLTCGVVTPGLLRLLLFGFNQDPIPSGEIATITFDVSPNARRRLHRLQNIPLGSDADANGLALTHKSGLVRVGER